MLGVAGPTYSGKCPASATRLRDPSVADSSIGIGNAAGIVRRRRERMSMPVPDIRIPRRTRLKFPQRVSVIELCQRCRCGLGSLGRETKIIDNAVPVRLDALPPSSSGHSPFGTPIAANRASWPIECYYPFTGMPGNAATLNPAGVWHPRCVDIAIRRGGIDRTFPIRSSY